MTSGCRIPVAAFCLVVALLLPAGGGAHVMATGLAVVTVNDREISYRLTVVPSELPEAASQLLSRAMAGSRPDAERIAEAMRPGRQGTPSTRNTTARRIASAIRSASGRDPAIARESSCDAASGSSDGTTVSR